MVLWSSQGPSLVTRNGMSHFKFWSYHCLSVPLSDAFVLTANSTLSLVWPNLKGGKRWEKSFVQKQCWKVFWCQFRHYVPTILHLKSSVILRVWSFIFMCMWSVFTFKHVRAYLCMWVACLHPQSLMLIECLLLLSGHCILKQSCSFEPRTLIQLI